MDAASLAQLTQIKWALVVIAGAFVVMAIATLGALWGMAQLPSVVKGKASFADQAKRLLDKGELDSLLELCDQHIAEYPGDANGYWFQAQADYRKGKLRRAVASLRRVRELQPDWEETYIAPLMQVLEERLERGADKPDLRVLTPDPPPEPKKPA